MTFPCMHSRLDLSFTRTEISQLLSHISATNLITFERHMTQQKYWIWHIWQAYIFNVLLLLLYNSQVCLMHSDMCVYLYSIWKYTTLHLMVSLSDTMLCWHSQSARNRESSVQIRSEHILQYKFPLILASPLHPLPILCFPPLLSWAKGLL